jgi:hypothetical protein
METESRLINDFRNLSKNTDFSPQTRLVLMQVQKKLKNKKLEVSSKIITEDDLKYNSKILHKHGIKGLEIIYDRERKRKKLSKKQVFLRILATLLLTLGTASTIAGIVILIEVFLYKKKLAEHHTLLKFSGLSNLRAFNLGPDGIKLGILLILVGIVTGGISGFYLSKRYKIVDKKQYRPRRRSSRKYSSRRYSVSRRRSSRRRSSRRNSSRRD